MYNNPMNELCRKFSGPICGVFFNCNECDCLLWGTINVYVNGVRPRHALF